MSQADLTELMMELATDVALGLLEEDMVGELLCLSLNRGLTEKEMFLWSALYGEALEMVQ